MQSHGYVRCYPVAPLAIDDAVILPGSAVPEPTAGIGARRDRLPEPLLKRCLSHSSIPGIPSITGALSKSHELFADDTISPVSYTHLRAHETPEHLVCRLLLEK